MSQVVFTRYKNFNLPVFSPVFLLKKHPSFARLFPNMGPSEELGTLQNGQKWFTWSLVRNGFPPFLRIIQTGREDPGGRKENFYNRTLALASRSTLTWESKVSYANANVLGLGDCRFMSIRKHCKPVGTNKDPKSKKFPVYRPGP